MGRAISIAQLTQLRISILSSGAPPGEVPADCFPSADSLPVTVAPRWVTFAPDVPTPMEDTQLQLTDTDRSPAGCCVTATDAETILTTPSEKTISPPPGFPQFQWPQADWILKGDPSIDPGLKLVTSWSTSIIKERAAKLPPPPPAALTDNSRGLSGLHYGAGGVSGRRKTHPGGTVPDKIDLRPLKREFQQKKTSSSRTFCGLRPWVFLGNRRKPTEIKTGRKYHDGAWPERDRSWMNALRVLGTGCAFRQTTYRAENLRAGFASR